MTSQIPARFTYQKDDTIPPVYVAGTFSSPPWQPIEMDLSQDENGRNTFYKVIDVSDASDIQYKFRIGSGDWWVCNESAEIGKLLVLVVLYHTIATIGIDCSYPVKDSQGNLNNILRISSRHSDETAFDRDMLERPDSQIGKVDSSPSSESPGGEAHEIDLEVPNTAGKLNAGESAPNSAEPSHPICPLFSHEYVVFPDEDDAYDETLEVPKSSLDDYQLRKYSETKQHEYAEDPDVDLDNPTLERFPSDSASIIATIRRLSTSVNEDRTLPQGTTPSLMVSPFKSSTDDLSDAQGLAVPQTGQPRIDMKKSSLSTSGGSITSLNSIAEADDERRSEGPDDSTNLGGGITRHGPAADLGDKGDGPASDDEGIAMCTVARERPAEGNLDGTDLVIPAPRDFIRLTHSHIVEPVLRSFTPRPEGDRIDSAEIINPNGLAINHARAVSPHIVISEDSNQNSQNSLPKGDVDRPLSRSSINSLHDVKSGANWLQAFIRVLLVEWIGGFISRLLYGKRRA